MSLLSALLEGLLPASFRGVPFAVSVTNEGFGRRIAPHIYPGRDLPWMEDMGRAPRSYRLSGFIVADDLVYLGGPIAAQRLLLTAAAEKKGSGLLTHPTFGILEVSCRGLSFGEDLAAASMSEISFDFIESGKQSFPSLLSIGSGLISAAALCDVAIAADFARVAFAAAGAVGASSAASDTGSAIGDQVVASGQDATALTNLAAQLPGNNGRYVGGANAGFASSTVSPYSADTTIGDLVAAASAQHSAVAAAATHLASASANLGDATSFATLTDAMTTLVASLLASCADPADAVRLLSALIATPPTLPAASSVIGSTIVMAFQRAAAVALVQACAQYQPSSYDDAFALLANASVLVDGVATAAADFGDDDSFDALNSLLVQLVADLSSRGATLSPIKAFTFARPLPDAVLAQRLYRDPSRADELVREANPIHPLFMPTSFQALAA